MSRSAQKSRLACLLTVIALGFVLIILSGMEAARAGSLGASWLLLALLTVLSGAFTLKIPGIDSRLSASDVFVFTSCALFGPAGGALTAALDGLTGSLRARRRPGRLRRGMFNTACMALSAYLAGKVFLNLLVGSSPDGTADAAKIVPAFFALALVYHLLNTGLVSVIVALDLRRNVLRIWSGNFGWTMIANIAAASTAGMIYLTSHSVEPMVLAAISVVAVCTYTSYRSVLSRERRVPREQDRPDRQEEPVYHPAG